MRDNTPQGYRSHLSPPFFLLVKPVGSRATAHSHDQVLPVSILMLCDERNSVGLRSATWVPEWKYPLRRYFERAITPDKPTTASLTTLMDDLFGQVSQALENGALGPEAFTLLLQLLSGDFDRVDSGAGYKKLHTFGVPNGTPFRDFSREFRVIVPAVTGTERVCATEPKLFGTLDAMWLDFQSLANYKTLIINGDFFLPVFSSSMRLSCPWAPARR